MCVCVYVCVYVLVHTCVSSTFAGRGKNRISSQVYAEHVCSGEGRITNQVYAYMLIEEGENG